MSAHDPREILDALAALGVQPVRLTADSRQVKPGDVFLAYPGARTDGRRYIGDAIARGAVAVLWENTGYQWDIAHGVPNVACEQLAQRAGELADRVYGFPSAKLRLIGVTGTNGKTSVTQWAARALTALHERCAVIGTLGIGFPGEVIGSENTTPDALVLQAALAEFRNVGARAVAIEMSSIGLEQGRANGAVFDMAVFTNLTRDHLDYHGTMAAYAAAKHSLFSWPGLRAAVLNLDDAFGVELAIDCADRLPQCIGYAAGAPPATLPAGLDVLAATDIRDTLAGMHFIANWKGERAAIEAPMVGRFNISNLLAVIGILLAAGYSLESAAEVVQTLMPPPGRMQIIGGVLEPLVVVDYAHTPDALEKALLALRPTAQTRGGKLVCLFGCGGGRDSGKRPLMGAVATRLADRVVLTNDNPRDEDPLGIIEQIAAGAGAGVARQPDREQAIHDAIRQAAVDDIILLAGKGHEPYQEIAGVRHAFSDIEQARAALKARRARPGGAA